MPIVDSQIVKNRVDNEIRKVFEQHTDHTGKIHCVRYRCPVDFDTATRLTENAASLEQSLVDSELEQIANAVERGEDPNAITQNHTTAIQKARMVVKALMKGEPRQVIKAAQFVQGFTDAQLLSVLTQEQVTKIRNRQNFVLDNLAVWSADGREEM